MGIDAVGGDLPLMPVVLPPATEWRAMPSLVGVGGTCPFEYRLTVCPVCRTGGRLGRAIDEYLGIPASEPERETGGAL